MARGFKEQGLNADSPEMKHYKAMQYEHNIKDSDFTNGAFYRPVYGTKAYKEWKERQSDRRRKKTDISNNS